MRTESKYIETDTRLDDDTQVSESRVTETQSDELSTGQAFASAVYTVAGIIISLITLRFMLLLLGANPDSNFANIIYSVTEIFIAPFYGLFGNTYDVQGVRFELESLIAIAIVGLASWIICRLLTINKNQ